MSIPLGNSDHGVSEPSSPKWIPLGLGVGGGEEGGEHLPLNCSYPGPAHTTEQVLSEGDLCY